MVGARAWLGAALLAVAVLTAVATLRPLLLPGPWSAVTTWSVLLVLAVTTTVRTVTGLRWAPTVWGSLVGIGLVAVLYSSPTGPSAPLPTLSTLRGLRRTVEQGLAAMADGFIPLEPGRGVEMLVVAGVVGAVLLADLLALGLGRAGAAGIAVAGVWSVSVVFAREHHPVLLVLGALSFLLLLALTRPDRPERPGRHSGSAREAPRTLLAAAAVTAAVLVMTPALASLPTWGSVRLPSVWGGSGAISGPVQLSLDLDMRASLGPRSDRPVLSYRTDGPAPGPLRLYTLTDFDGREWLPHAPGSEEPGDADPAGLLWPDDDVAAEPTGTLRIEVGDLDQDRLPLPLEPRELRLPDAAAWRYDPVRDEVRSGTTTTRGLAYDVEVTHRDLSAERLQADAPPELDDSSPYLTVPATAAADEVRALAQQLTAGAATTYDQALALQTYLRDTSVFRYDTTVPAAASQDAVWDFLTARRGYCVQYATAMTMMARHLGIPARMGVGFLPGRPDRSTGQHVVTGRLAHTWPELWFAGSGWVRFEPTPAAQTGAPPVYADPLTTMPVTPEEPTPTSEPAPLPTATPTTPSAPGGAPGGDVALGPARVPLLLPLGLGALLALATVLVARRRSRREDELDPEQAWALLARRAQRHGIAWVGADTPRTAYGTVRDALPPDRGHDGLHRLLGAVEDVRYGPTPRTWDPQDLAAWVDEVDAGLRAGRSSSAETRTTVTAPG